MCYELLKKAKNNIHNMSFQYGFKKFDLFSENKGTK